MRTIIILILGFVINIQNIYSQNFWQTTSVFPNGNMIYGWSIAKDHGGWGNIVVGGDAGQRVFGTTNGGSNWTDYGLVPGNGKARDMALVPWQYPFILVARYNSSIQSNDGLCRYYQNSWGTISLFNGKEVRAVMAKNYLFAGVSGASTDRGIWRSVNDGDNWTRVLDWVEIYCFDVRNNKHYAGGYYTNNGSGMLLQSGDLGGSWTNIGDFPYMVVGVTVTPSDNIFVALSNGQIYASIGGKGWQIVKSNVWNEYYRIPLESNNLNHVYITDKGTGVWRTLDNGANWELVNAGLPTTQITDIHVNINNQQIWAVHESFLMSSPYKSIEPTNLLSTPIITPVSGVFPPSFNAAITSISYPPIEIRYTTDGSDPNSNSTLYSVPITVSGTTNFLLKARVFKTGFNPSDTARVLYYFLQSPSLLSPVNGLTGISRTPLFQWTSTSALSYRLQVSTDSTFTTNLFINDSNIFTNQYQVVNPLNYLTKYYWRVNAKYNDGTSTYSNPYFSLTTVVAPPNPPNLLLPLNNAIDIPTSVAFKWSKPQNAHTYRLQVATDQLFNNIFFVDSVITDTIKIVSNFNNNTQYWWRVSAKSDGGWGGYSNPVFNFRTVIGIPGIPNLISPNNNSIDQLLSLNLVWNKSAGATFYKLLLAKDSLFTNIVLIDTTLTDSIKNVSDLNYFTKYWWKVAAKNSNGSSEYSNHYNFRTVIQPCLVSWQAKITANDAGNGNDSLFFGKSPDALNGLDPCLGEVELPPVPPIGIFDYRLILPSTPVMASKKDYRHDTTSTIVWRMTFQASNSGYPITFNWNTLSLPQGIFYLKDEITGTIVNVNMKSQNSYILTNVGITSLKIEYSSALSVNIPFTSSWNLLSVPLLANNMSVGTLFPTSTPPAFEYNNNGYYQVNTLTVGKGFWLLFNNLGNANITGTSVTPRIISVISDWNMIGPFENNVLVSSITTNPPGIINSNFFDYNNGYFMVDTLKSGRGYWVSVSQNGNLILPGVIDYLNISKLFINKDKYRDKKESWIKLIISDKENKSSTLYLAQREEMTDTYILPPIPPMGIFDVRFSSNSYTEMIGLNQHIINVHTNQYPIKIKAENLGKSKMRIKDNINGKLFDKILLDNSELTVNEPINSFALLEEELPKEFLLSQNYPNPFNPITHIKYSLPENVKVKLTLYDILGREVKVLVNEFKEAGNYTFELKANDLSSGIYFYKFESGNFMDIKKMVIIK